MPSRGLAPCLKLQSDSCVDALQYIAARAAAEAKWSKSGSKWPGYETGTKRIGMGYLDRELLLRRVTHGELVQ